MSSTRSSRSSSIVALIDGNNFYVSCERLFDPKLEHRPVIVMSNNDGMVISRSDKAKTLEASTKSEMARSGGLRPGRGSGWRERPVTASPTDRC